MNRFRSLALAALLPLVAVAGACNRGGGGGTGTGGGSAEGSATATTLGTGSCTEDEKFDTTSGHVRNPKYEIDPPAGGEHTDQAALPAVYGDKAPPDGALVHTLEHGDIVVWYQPGLAAADVDSLSDLARKYPRHVLLVERDRLDVPIAATAWQHRILCTGLDVERLSAWIEENRNKGPEGFVD